MTTILLNEATRAALAAVRAANQSVADASAETDAIFKRDWPAMSAATDAWRLRFPAGHISASDRDPAVIAAGAAYHAADKRRAALSKVLDTQSRGLAAEVVAQVKAHVARHGFFPMPTLTVEKRKVGWRCKVNGEQARDTARAVPYTAVGVVLWATVTAEGISGVGWRHTGEFSATAKRLTAEALKFAPYARVTSDVLAPIQVLCARQTITAQLEAQS